jgi:hypothetical protein
VPVVGPDASSGFPPLDWVRAAAGLAPAVLTAHYYPLTSCGGTTVAVADLLASSTRTLESSMLTDLAAIQRSSGIPLRLDETNNVSCGGAAVSTSFASALWAADYIGRVASSGVAGLNFMDRPERLIDPPKGAYSPLAVTDRSALQSGALRAYPEWYALLLARSLLGDQPVHASVSAPGAALTAYALREPGGRLHVLLVNFDPPGSEPLLVRIEGARSWHRGTILRLTAPSPASASGVRLGGRAVTGHGTWAPSSPLPGVYVRGGSRSLAMPPDSAALVTLA